MFWFLQKFFNIQASQTGILNLEGQQFKCSIGSGGIKTDKKEGDGATPAGDFPLRQLFYRPDRIKLADIQTELPFIALGEDDGWCDDPNSPRYNQWVKLPFVNRHEKLWREDNIYDLIIVVGYNDNPVVKDKGSAIFIHIARPDYTPTAGCIALKKEDLLNIIKRLGTSSHLRINENGLLHLYPKPALQNLLIKRLC